LQLLEAPRAPVPGDLVESLDAYEREILALFADGWSRDEIAARLGLSPRTVGNRLTVAKEKLAARSLTHAAVILRMHQLLQAARPADITEPALAG
jgi:DNA-binding NarL/FixJ family response regulator